MKSLVSLLSALLLCGCTVGPDFVPPEAHVGPSYAAPGDLPLPSNQKLAAGNTAERPWWEDFHVAALDQMIAQALGGNRHVAAARARIAAAEADTAAAKAALLPQVTLLGAVGAQNFSVGQHTPLNITLPPFEYYAAGPALDFPLDLFGGGKRAAEEAAAFADYQNREGDAATLSLIANIAAQALRNAAARDQIADLDHVIDDDQRNVALVQSALNSGSATRTQLLSVQSQLAADRTLLPDFRQQEAISRHALAVLLGKAPADWTAPDFALKDFALAPEIPASLPSELIHRRPDILAAEAQLHMASAAIGVATADLYPKIDLNATLVLEALTPTSLAKNVISEWTAAANLTAPLFDGGKLSAKRRAALETYQAALEDYQNVVLAAFGEVADDLQALANDADRVHAEAEAMRTADASLDLARKSYQAGNSGILDVIDAERRSAQAQLGLSRAQAQRLLDTVALYVALGGTKLPPAPPAQAAPNGPCCDY